MNRGQLVPASPPHSPVWTAADREVSATTRDRLERAISPNTRRAYSRWGRDYRDFCDLMDRTALPGTPETLAEYISHLVDLGVGVSSYRQAIAAIRSMHNAAGFHDQPNAYAARLIARGEAKAAARRGVRKRQAPPLALDDLRRMVDLCDPESLRGTRDRLILVLGFTALLRRSEGCSLMTGDVKPCRDPSDGLDVFIAASKTDQEAEGVTTTVPWGRDPLSCPVTALAAYQAARNRAGLDPGPLLRAIGTGGKVGGRCTEEEYNDVVKELAIKAQLEDAELYSSHSLRSGGAVALYLAGLTIDDIILQGRWAPGSTVVMTYIRALERGKRNPMRGVV